jgi:hypothetical protein
VNATPYLSEIARALAVAKLDAVLIGNAAAALQGAPVTTVDFDFLFRRTPRNLQKLKVFAQQLRAVVLRPYYPTSDMFRVQRDDGLQVDFMGTVHGLRSFEGVRDRADILDMGGAPVSIASLADVIRSKRAAGRPRDLAVLDVLEQVDAERQKGTKTGNAGGAARRASSRKRPRPS